MKQLIYPNQQTAISADEETAGFDIENVQDEHPLNIWKATSQNAQIKVTVSAGSNGVMIAGINLSEFDLTIKNVAEDTTYVATTTYETRAILTYEELITDTYEELTEYWIDYTYQETAIKLIFDVTCISPALCQIGIIRAGRVTNCRSPLDGWSLGYTDYSITKRLRNGSMHYKKLPRVRKYSVSQKTVSADFIKFIKNKVAEIGPEPFASRIYGDNQDHVGFFMFDRLLSGTYSAKNKVATSITLTEVT